VPLFRKTPVMQISYFVSEKVGKGITDSTVNRQVTNKLRDKRMIIWKSFGVVHM